MKKSQIFVIILLFIACEKSSNNERIYRVKAGTHFCIHEVKPYNKHSIRFWFEVNDTWNWSHYVHGWSKIYGIGALNHKQNSARLAFRTTPEEMMLGLYVYANGTRHSCYICTIIYGWHHCEISRENNEWICRINNKQVGLPAGNKYLFGQILHPHIGGEYTVSKEWVILINQK